MKELFAEFNLNSKQQEQLHLYFEHLVKTNENINLTSIIKVDEVYIKHYYDSLLLTKVLPLTNQSLIDVGTGAGFPGLVLKIYQPDIKLSLLDSNAKKIHFLETTAKLLDIEFLPLCKRSEEVKERNTYDIVVSRAVANLKVILEVTYHLAKVNGYLVCYKGKNYETEVQDAKDIIKQLGLVLVSAKEFVLPLNMGERTILVYQKTKDDTRFPRSYAKIVKSK
jgi:16S rRNA (guanine527-N7)-methyltransferase